MDKKTTKKIEDYDDVLSISDVCCILGVGVTPLRQLIRSKEIMGFKIGKNIKIPKTSLLGFIHNKYMEGKNRKEGEI